MVTCDDFYPFGQLMDGRSKLIGQPDARYKFTGKERDQETGWDYFGARYYDSRIGRWLSTDQLAEEYVSWSPYVYVRNSPLTSFDPNGKGDKNAIKGAAIGTGVGLVLGSMVVGGAEILTTGLNTPLAQRR